MSKNKLLTPFTSTLGHALDSTIKKTRNINWDCALATTLIPTSYVFFAHAASVDGHSANKNSGVRNNSEVFTALR